MTSIKPPLILIHFVVSRELLLIKCVPDCIMGVSRVPLHKVNSPHYSHQTLVCVKFLNTDGDGSRRLADVCTHSDILYKHTGFY